MTDHTTNNKDTEGQQTDGDGPSNLVALYPDLPERVAAAQEREGLSQNVLSKRFGVSPPVLRRWLDGSRTRSDAQIQKAAIEWLREIEGRGAGADPFVETKASRKIIATLAHAQVHGDMVCIYGGPGVGKTRTIAHYRARFPNVWSATMAPSCARPVPALEEVAEAVGIGDTNGGARRLVQAIRAQVSGCRGLIIIDEAQHLSPEAIEEIRSIHDWCREEQKPVGLALMGNEQVYKKLTGPSRAEGFAQLFSRLGMKLQLKRPDGGDVRLIAKPYEVTDTDALRLLEEVALRPGGLRAVVKICALAKASAEEDAQETGEDVQPLDREAIRDAIHHLGLGN